MDTPDCTNADGSNVQHAKPTGPKTNHTSQMNKAHSSMAKDQKKSYPATNNPEVDGGSLDQGDRVRPE